MSLNPTMWNGLAYYESNNRKKPLLLLHAQGTASQSFENVFSELSQYYHVYAVDCYGHGFSEKNPDKYNIVAIGSDMISFIREVIGGKTEILGHSSGALIGAYIAAESDCCTRLILEDPQFFSTQGERRFSTYHYNDLSLACNDFLNQSKQKDFVTYYFEHQYAWRFFPEADRESVRRKATARAARFRRRHPDKNLKVLFWPKAAMEAFVGMQYYDPRFGKAFYDDSFHCGIPHEEILKKIQCDTVVLKAKTETGDEGILYSAMSDEDLLLLEETLNYVRVIRFDCGHGIHIVRAKQFMSAVIRGRI